MGREARKDFYARPLVQDGARLANGTGFPRWNPQLPPASRLCEILRHFVPFVMDNCGAKFKNTALIFLEILFFQHFTIFNCKQYDVITDLICIIEKRNISETKKDISKRKTPFFCILKGLSNKQKLFFTSYAL